jgi:DNA-binding NarL/FixJ family response regulator
VIRVLIIDDHETVEDALVRLLSQDPEIEVLGSVGAGSAGLEQASKDKPDIVLIDLVVPDMEAAAATHRLKQTSPAIKVITLTGAYGPDTPGDVIEAGASAWECKTK